MAEQNEHEDLVAQGEIQAATSRRKPRLNEAPVSPATLDEAKQESRAERSPEWPAQYEGDGWDQVPVQMRNQR